MNAPQKYSVIALAVATLFSSHLAFAEESAKADKQLKEVEVVGTSPLPGLGIEEDKLPYDVQTVNAEQLHDSQTMNLTEFMSRNLSGVNINDIQGSPFQADITYRGFRLSGILGSSQGLSVYLDGVRVNEPFGDVVNWDMIPEAAINNVTLVPGSNPIYGLNTLGGALAFTTKSGLTAPGTEVKLQAGSFGRVRADVAYGSKSEDGYHSFISATGFRENGWREHSSGQLGNVFAKVGRQQGDSNWDLSLLVGRSTLIGNGLLPSRNYGSDGDDGPDPGMYENNRRWVYTHPDQTRNELNQLTFNLQRMMNSETELAGMLYVRQALRKGFSGDVEREQSGANYSNEGAINLNNSRQTSAGGSLNLTRIMDRHQITAGVSSDFAHMRYGAERAEDCAIGADRAVYDCDPAEGTAGVRGKSAAMGLYASDTFSYSERTFITGAARFNHAYVSNIITNYTGGVGSDRAREAFTYNSLNPSLGISHKLAPAVTLFGSVGQSNRVPTIIELGCADPATPCALPTGLQADPYLKQVIARTVEFGTRWRFDDSEITATVYRSDNSNDILFQATGTSPVRGYFTNFGRTLRQGLDLSARTSYGPVAVQASYSYLDATYQSEGELFGGDDLEIDVKRGTRIAGLPQHTLRVSADWRVEPKVTIGGSMLATSSIGTQGNEAGNIGEDGTGDASVKGYFLMNLHANYEASKGMDYFARINNVFDRRYETYGMIAASSFDQFGAGLGTSTNPGNISRFVAPGAPRSFMVGVRYRY